MKCTHAEEVLPLILPKDKRVKETHTPHTKLQDCKFRAVVYFL